MRQTQHEHDENAIRIMSDREVEHLTSLKRNTRYSMTARGDFPAPVWITGRTRGYMSDEVYAWLEERREKRSIRQVRPWTPENSRGAAQ